MSLKILLICPHPDDIEIAMAMRAHDYIQKGHEVHEIVLCRGELGGDPDVREKEARCVADVLGIAQQVFYNHPNTRFDEVRIPIKDDIENNVKKIRPDIVYAPWPKDEHIDHVITGKETLVAARSVPTIVYYECQRSEKFSPNLAFYAGKESMDKKLEAISCNISQLEKGAISLEFALVQGQYWAHKFNHHACVQKIREDQGCVVQEKIYAEVFHIHRATNSHLI